MCGGGGTTSSQTFSPPGWTSQGWQDLVSNAQGLSSIPYQQYNGMQVAPINGDQAQAQNMIQDRALYGAPDLNTGRQAAMNIAGGTFFNNSPWTDVSGGQPFQGEMLNSPYVGQAQNSPWTSPEFTNNAIQQNATQMANAAAIGTNAQTDAMFARNGAFGGSAWQQQQQMNQLGLNNAVAQMANNYRLQNAQMGNQNYMTGAQMGNQNVANAAQMGNQNFMTGQQMGNSNFMQGIQQMLAAGGLAGNLSQDDWTSGNALMQMGAFNQQYTQNLLNNQYQNFQNQIAFPANQLQMMNNVLSAASGNYGTQTTNPFSNSNGNIITSLLGLGGLGAAGYQAINGGGH